MAFRPFLLAAAVMPLSLVACGGDDGEETIVPEGTHYKYVANQVFLPTTSNQAREYGLDLNGDKNVDNQLGMVLSTLAGTGGFDLQGAIDTAVAEGDIVLLVDFQTKDFTNTTAAGVQVYLGDNPTPAPCNAGETYNDMTKTGCKRHLDGNGSFAISADSPTNAALGGKIVNGTFNGGNSKSDLTLQVALGGMGTIELNLIGARAKGSSISESGIGTGTTGGMVFAGAVTKDDIDNEVIPAIHGQLGPTITQDCPTPTASDCGCMPDSTGKTVLSFFDSSPKDCMVTLDEIKNNSLIVSLLAPDVTIEGKMALSLGVKATAVKATYTVPGQ